MRRRAIAILVAWIVLSFSPTANGAQRLFLQKPLADTYPALSVGQMAALQKEGISILEDYGPFLTGDGPDTIDTVSASAATSLWISKDPTGHRLQIAGFDIDTSSEGAVAGLDPDLKLADYSGEVGLYLVQFHGPLRPEWLTLLTNQGIRPIQYVDSNSYLVAAPPTLPALKTRLAVRPVQYVGVFQPGFKLAPGLRAMPVADVRTLPVTALLDGAQDLTDTFSVLGAIDGSYKVGAALQMGRRVSFNATAAQVRFFATLGSVLWMEEIHTMRPSDESVAVLAIGNAVSTSGSYADPVTGWLATHGLGDLSSNVVHVLDTGVTIVPDPATGLPDTDICETSSALFGGHIDLNGGPNQARLKAACPTYDNSCLYKLADGFGHGTLVASVIAGNPQQEGGGNSLPNANDPKTGFLLGTGIAPTARVVSTKFENDTGSPCTPPDFSSWAYTANQPPNGATFQNCSSNFSDTHYTLDSATYDSIVRHGGSAQASAPMTVVFSAGNDSGNVTAPATAKNVITVGASGPTRTELGLCTTCAGSVSCDEGFTNAINASDVAAYSNRGFAFEQGHFKPDLVAPGLVTGAFSHALQNYRGCAATAPLFGPDGQYFRAHGTSFAAPQVTGAAVLINQIFLSDTNMFQHSPWGPPAPWAPSPSLVKAILIGSAMSMHGGTDYQSTPPTPLGWEPSTPQGWGRLNLGNPSSPAGPPSFFDGAYKLVGNEDDINRLFTYTGQVFSYNLHVSDPTKPVIVVLTWSDYPAAAGATSPMVNRLALYATRNGLPDKHYCDGEYGAQYSPQHRGIFDPCPASDSKNNVKVLKLAPFSGPVTIAIHGTAIQQKVWLQDPDPNHTVNQDWSLYVYNAYLN